MFECTICGLLSLNSISCPACGSQNLVDLSLVDDGEALPAEIPGLDDAAESWHDLEGSAMSNSDDNGQGIKPQDSFESNLPFGYSGQSNISMSRLPFGIGSHAEGIPFEHDSSDSNLVEKEVLSEVQLHESDSAVTELPSESSDKVELLEVVVSKPKPLRIDPIMDGDSEHVLEDSISLPTDFEQQNDESLAGVPDEWRINVSEANIEEIYSSPEEVVEVVHSFEEDVVVFHHHSEPNSGVQDRDYGLAGQISLELHPARAMDVDLSKHPECRKDLDLGFFAIAKGSWPEAAIRFQKVASRMPGDSAVFNNYGLALLQRAIEMAKDNDESIQMLASSQFESAILALREAAKSSPDEAVILLNLAHALLVSGRSEKAQKIIEVHNSKNPNSIEGANLEAATLVSLGQSVNAKSKLASFRGDSIIDENLARLL